MSRYITLAVFLIAVVGGGMLIGASFPTGAWYAALNKPWFNPPNGIFPPVWTVLYIMIAIAGWRTWQRDRSGTEMKAWFVQMALNFLWSPVMFGANRLTLALVIIVGMLMAITLFVIASARKDAIATWLFVPYLAWVAFATILNASLVVLN